MSARIRVREKIVDSERYHAKREEFWTAINSLLTNNPQGIPKGLFFQAVQRKICESSLSIRNVKLEDYGFRNLDEALFFYNDRVTVDNTQEKRICLISSKSVSLKRNEQQKKGGIEIMTEAKTTAGSEQYSTRRNDLWKAVSKLLIENPDGVSRGRFFPAVICTMRESESESSMTFIKLADYGFRNLDEMLIFYNNRLCVDDTEEKRISLIPDKCVYKYDNVNACPTVLEPFNLADIPQKKTIEFKAFHYAGILTIEKVNQFAKICIEELSELGEYVSVERIEKLLLQRLQVQTINQLKLPRVHAIEHIEPIKEHTRLLSKVNAYIQAFCLVRSICTLTDLEENLASIIPDNDDFTRLRVGPLHKLPIIYDLFKFPYELDKYPKISSLRLIQIFREYLTEEEKWTGKLDMQEFMTYLCANQGVPDAFHLGVRIRSLPLLTSVLKKAQRDASANQKSILETFKQEAQADIEVAVKRFKASIIQPNALLSHQYEVKKHYMEVSCDVAVMEIMEKFLQFIGTEQPQSRQAKRTHRATVSLLNDFSSLLRNDRMLAMLFRLAVCVSKDDVEDILKRLAGGGAESSASSNEDTDSSSSSPQALPSADLVANEISHYLERCIIQNKVTLSNLEKIEGKILDHYDLPSFYHLGLESFIKFLLSHRNLKKLLEENCGTVLGSGEEGVARVDHKDAVRVIQQAHHCGVDQSSDIENILCSQFGTSSIKSLGCGSMSRLENAASTDRHESFDKLLVYEAALCPPSSLVSDQPAHSLGDQSRDSALIALHTCPLLTDLALWTNWPLVFEPKLGCSLKEFIHKYGGLRTCKQGSQLITIDICALEIAPTVFLKLKSETDIEAFKRAIIRSDAIETCGHLVSLVVKHCGIRHTPLPLLANHMKSTLFSMHESSNVNISAGYDEETPGKAVYFILSCLNILPRRIAVTLATEMFIDPLGQVLGISRAKILLLQAARTTATTGSISSTDFAALNTLHYLGLALGIPEWTDDLQQQWMVTDRHIDTNDPWMTLEEEELVSNSDSTVTSNDDESSIEGEEPTMQDFIANEDEPFEESTDTTNDDVSDSSEYQSGVEGLPNVPGDLKNEGDLKEGEEDDEVEVNACKMMIEKLRKERFGIGVELNDEGRKFLEAQQEMLGRSLDRLSHDLYSKDTHFVLELIQNADDNKYPAEMMNGANGVFPSVKFIVTDDRVCIYNNECGFEEENISAICNVGNSTKGKHKYGYIGQKGIGFKSVFRVTDRPEIHSNGYHMNFDKNSGNMGYILPHWIDCDDTCGGCADKAWMTRIILPFKGTNQYRMLAARFSEIHPSLLLFLHRLRCIVIENTIERRSLTMQRRDIDSNVVNIQNGDLMETWFVVKKMLDASNIALSAKSDADVESTEIALAFLVPQNLLKPSAKVAPVPKQPVFAYLPLRSYGFRFIIQGDFDVPASREDVKTDSAWNHWLCQEIPALFMEALKAFHAHPMFDRWRAICAFFQFIPFDDEIIGFFKPVASQILQKLRSNPCMPTQPNSKGDVLWKKPCEVVTTRDPLIYEVISSDLLMAHLNLYYLHADVASILTHSLVKCLGVETIGTEHLLHIGRSLSLNIGATGDADLSNKIITISKWLACVHRSKDDLHAATDDILNEVRSLKIYPLTSGQFVSLDTHTVFFPLKEGQDNKDVSRQLVVLQRDLNTIDSQIFQTSDDIINSQVQKILRDLGLKSLKASEVVTHHIMPVLVSGDWKTKSRELLVSYLVYLREVTDSQPHLVDMVTLRQCAPVITNRGVVTPSMQAVHFTPLYGNDIDLPVLFPGYNWTLVDACYMPGQSTKTDVRKWREFFFKLGIVDFLLVKEEKITLSHDDVEKSVWAPVKNTWPQQRDGYIVNDFVCQEFEDLVTKNTKPDLFIEQMSRLCMLIDREWDSRYKQYTNAQVSSMTEEFLKDAESSFGISLKTLPWITAYTYIMEERVNQMVVSRKLKMCRPSDIYVANGNIEDLLGCTVDYLAVEMSKESSFLTFLQVKTLVKVEVVVEMLKQWGQRQADNSPGEFVTSMHHITVVYKYIFDNLSRKSIQDMFKEFSVIFVPLKITAEPHQHVRGQMLNREEVWWCDPTKLIAKYRASLRDYHLDIGRKVTLEEIYNTMRDIFLDNLVRIQQQPSLKEYAQLLRHISNTESLVNNDAVLRDVMTLFDFLGYHLCKLKATDDDTQRFIMQQDVKEMLVIVQNERVFPVKGNKWTCLADHPMISDDHVLETWFSNKDGFHIINSGDKLRNKDRRRGREPETDTQATREFLRTCGVELLSSCVKLDLSPGLTQPCPQAQLYLHKTLPHIQRFIYSNYNTLYQFLMESKISSKIKTVIYYQVSKLEVVYSLTHNPDIMVIRNETCMFKDTEFYIHHDFTQSYSEINKELAKYFALANADCAKELRYFLTELEPLLNNKNKNIDVSSTVAELLERYGVDELPENEELWEVPKPLIEIPKVIVKPLLKKEDAADPSKTASESTLKMWPPKSSESVPRDNIVTTGAAAERPASKVWPPPKAPDYLRDVKELPEGIRIIKVVSPGEEMPEKQPSEARLDSGGNVEVVVVCEDGTTPYRNTARSEDSSAAQNRSTDNSDVVSSNNRHQIETVIGNSAKSSAQSIQNVIVENAQDSAMQNEVTDIPSNSMGEIPPAHKRSLSETPEIPDPKRFLLNMALPIWDQNIPVIPYEDLASGADLQDLPTIPLNASNDSSCHEIGLWGEELVYNYLTQLKESGNIQDVVWTRERGLLAAPYDFLVTVLQQSTSKVEDYFIEVKTTLSENKENFEISSQEIRFAFQKKAYYHVYRVYGACNKEKLRLVRIRHLADHMDKNAIKLFMTL